MPGLPIAKPEEIGLDPARLQRAYDLLESWTRGPNPAVPAGAILAGRYGKVVETKRFGHYSAAAGSPALRDDALFLMASITKPIVYLSAMLLVERGQLNLSDLVTRYIPDFAAHHKEDTQVIHLFTHTSGMPDMLENNVELRKSHATLAAFIEGAIRDTVPLFPPGTKVSYQSMGTLIVAELVQRITGKPIAEWVHQEVFAPLGLKSIFLGAKGIDRGRIPKLQVPDHLATQGDNDYDWNSRYWQELGAPWGGMVSTPEDMAVILQMLLNRGRYGDVQLLSPITVERMTTNRLDDLPLLDEASRRTQPWGLGWRLNHPALDDSWGDLLGPWTFGHTGASGTMVWADPDRHGFAIFLTNALRARAPWRLVHLSNAVSSAFLTSQPGDNPRS